MVAGADTAFTGAGAGGGVTTGAGAGVTATGAGLTERFLLSTENPPKIMNNVKKI